MPAYRDIDLEDSVMLGGPPPVTLVERLVAFKQLVFSKTRLEFNIIWNKVFQSQEDELVWLLDPHRQTRRDINMMTSLKNNGQEPTYHYTYTDIPRGAMNQRRVKQLESNQKDKKKKSTSGKAIQIARYMGMGAYMTSTAFPSPFMPSNDQLYNYDRYGLDRAW